MRENYNSFKFWETVISRNKTIRGHMFMQKPPNEKSMYFHTLIFGDKNGVNNIWGYVPNMRCLIGYIQYSFLQEAFYKWIYGSERIITKIPHLTVEKIIHEGEKSNKISKEIANDMKRDHEFFNVLWGMPNHKVEMELRKFLMEFNRRWMGDNKKFIYMIIFKTPEELGEFVISSSLITNTKKELEERMDITIDEWKDICKSTLTNSDKGEEFRRILLKKLSQVF